MITSIRRILVLCEGNHCRSPLAEALLRQSLGPDVSVTSAGLGAMVGQPAHEETQRLALEQGLDLQAHRGRPFSPELALGADLILVMDQAQKATCEALVPSARGRVFLLGHWLPEPDREIADPIQRGPEIHQQAHQHIQRALQPWLLRLSPRNP